MMRYAAFAGIAIACVCSAFLLWDTGSPDDPLAEAMAEPRAAKSGRYAFTEASEHIGEKASVMGTPLTVYRSKKGTVFFDYCERYASCPFSAVIFSSDTGRFGDLARYENVPISVTGTISSYQGRAEMVLKDPSQIRAI